MTTLKSEIAGTKFYSGAADILGNARDGTQVILVAEPTNEHDSNAIRCEIAGQMCGYVPRILAEQLAPMLAGGRVLSANLRGYKGLDIEIRDDNQEESQ